MSVGLRRALDALRLGLAFLTRIPGPETAPDDQALGTSVYGWALAGPAVGVVSAGALTVGAWGVSPAVGAVLALTAGLWFTRGFHLDGLSDCFDGLLCNGDRERTLRVMHDPHVGALASAAVTVCLLARVALIVACVDRGVALGALLIAPTLARVPLALEVQLGHPATDTGLLATLHRVVPPLHARTATLLALLLLVPAVTLVPLPALGVAVIAAGLVTAWWHGVWVRRIGGLNGDVLGAAVELRELGVLCALASPLLT